MQDSVFVCKTTPIGFVEIWRKDPGATLYTLVHSLKNLITDVGRAAFAGLQIATGTAPAYAAVGDGTTAAVVGDTTLESERYRAAAVRSLVTTTVANDTAYYDTTINVTATYDITEAGLLSLATLGVLYARQVFTAVPVSNGVVLKVVWKFQN